MPPVLKMNFSESWIPLKLAPIHTPHSWQMETEGSNSLKTHQGNDTVCIQTAIMSYDHQEGFVSFFPFKIKLPPLFGTRNDRWSLIYNEKILHFFCEGKDNPPPCWYPCASPQRTPTILPMALPYSRKVAVLTLDCYSHTQVLCTLSAIS